MDAHFPLDITLVPTHSTFHLRSPWKLLFDSCEGPLPPQTFELIGGQLTSVPCSITALWMVFLVILKFIPQ